LLETNSFSFISEGLIANKYKLPRALSGSLRKKRIGKIKKTAVKPAKKTTTIRAVMATVEQRYLQSKTAI
jgi:hypothetical protein